MATIAVDRYLGLVGALRDSPGGVLWSSYDREADVLYINFRRPPETASDSELTDDDVIIRYDGDEVVGLTVLHASLR